MNRGSAARTGMFCHIWVMQASIGKCSQLHGCSDRLRLWVCLALGCVLGSMSGRSTGQLLRCRTSTALVTDTPELIWTSRAQVHSLRTFPTGWC